MTLGILALCVPEAFIRSKSRQRWRHAQGDGLYIFFSTLLAHMDIHILYL